MSDEQLDQLTRSVVAELEKRKKVPTVEETQDVVEEKLIAADYAKTAKAYILYRAEHQKLREMDDELVKIYSALTFVPAEDADLKRENANINADTAMGTMLKYGSEGAKSFYDKYVIPPHIAKAHADGQIHIHDKDFYTLTETCCQIDLIKLFHNGFSTGHGYLREPPRPSCSYAALACIAIQANQNEMHGGQSVPIFDYAMAPGRGPRPSGRSSSRPWRRVPGRPGWTMPYGDVEAMIDSGQGASWGTRSPPSPPSGTRTGTASCWAECVRRRQREHFGVDREDTEVASARGRRPATPKRPPGGRRTRPPTRPWRPWCTT